MNRRTFLKSTLAGTGVATLVGNHSAADAPPRIKIGFLGGSHSHAFEKIKLTRSSPDYQLVGLCEDSAEVRRRFADLNVEFLSQDELLKQADVIAVESAVRHHNRQARLALSAGKHVHLEKPPADTLRDLEAMVALAREKRRLLQMGYMWRFNPGINAALEAARKGWLGEVFLVRATINTTLGSTQRREVAEFRGGTMFELGSHVIDPIVRLLGRPAKVTSYLKSHGQFDDKLADNTAAVLEYPKATALVTSATLQPGAGAHRFFEILGTNGTALVKPLEQPVLQIDLAKPAGPYAAKTQTINFPPYKRYVPEFAELAEAIRNGHGLAVSSEEELVVQETLLRACEMM